MVEFESSNATDKVTLVLFCQTLKTVQRRHSDVVQTMAQGVLELKETHAVDNQTDMHIQYFLDRFYMSRISIKMLIHQVLKMKSKRLESKHFNNCSTHFCLSRMLTGVLTGLG